MELHNVVLTFHQFFTHATSVFTALVPSQTSECLQAYTARLERRACAPRTLASGASNECLQAYTARLERRARAVLTLA